MRRLICFVAPLILLAANAGAQVVISQVYGGGGNSNATYTNDFVELFNRGTAPVTINAWSVQYTSSSSTGLFSANVTSLAGVTTPTLQPGQYFLVQLSSNAPVGAAMPAPDKTGTTAAAAGAGKFILANTTAGLACNGSSTVCSSADLAKIVDLVGYGTGTNFFEGTGPTPTISATTAAIRKGGGCIDSNNNSSDFQALLPTPRNTASPLNLCTVHFTSTSPLPPATLGTLYSNTFAAAGGSGSGYTYLQTDGTLPPGLTLNGAVLSGTPNDASSSPYSFTIQVTDGLGAKASQVFSLAVASPMTFTPNTLSAVAYGNSLSQPVTTDRTGCNFTPSGFPGFLSLTDVTGTGFTLSGTPTSVGTFNFSVGAVCADGSGTQAYSLLVTGVTVTFSPTTLPDGAVNTAYSQIVSTPNGIGCSFSVTAGALPTGFSLTGSGSSTTIAGTSTTAASAAFTLLAACTNGAGSQSYTLNIPLTCGAPKTYIHDVQGPGATSPMVGSTVEIEGIVTASLQNKTTQMGGFYMQEPDGLWDSNPLTSEGVFVYDSGFGVAVNTGDLVRVQGKVAEYSSATGSLVSSLTEVGSVTGVKVCSTGNSFQKVTVTLPVSDLTVWERYEGMAVQFTQQLVVTSTYEAGSHGSVDLSAGTRLYTPTAIVAPGAGALTQEDLNRRSLITLDDGSTLASASLANPPYPEGGLSALNTVRTGNWVNFNSATNTYTPVTGVLDDRYGTYRIQPLGSYTFHTPTAVNARTLAPDPVGGRIRVGSANLYNFFTTLGSSSTCGPTGSVSCRGASNATEYQRQLAKLVAELNGLNADIIGLSELENNAPGIPNAATVNSIGALVDALNAAAGAGTYAYIDTGTTGTDSIRNALVYKPARVTPVAGAAYAVYIPTPYGMRPSIAQLFAPAVGNKASLQQFTVVVNHFRSKGGDCSAQGDPDANDGQGTCNLNRLTTAREVIDWLATNPMHDPAPAASRKILMVGDFNSYFMEDPIQAMINPAFTKAGYLKDTNATYINLINKFLGAAAYSYQYVSESGYLDHALASPAMTKLTTGVAEWHNNSDEPPVLDYSTASKSAAQVISYYNADAYRASDHDPFVVGFNPLPGDLNDDGVVDMTDQALLRAQFGKAVGAPGVDRRMDYDGDGVISMNDYRVWATYYLAYQAATN
jgi:hypothetical protein